MIRVVLVTNLSDVFDIGALIANKITVRPATNAQTGIVRFATAAEASAGAADLAIDAATAASLYATQADIDAAVLGIDFETLLNAWFDTLQTDPNSPTVLASGKWWNDGGVPVRVP